MARNKIQNITLHHSAVISLAPPIEHERSVAMADLLESNHFSLGEQAPGPYDLNLLIRDKRLIMEVSNKQECQEISIPLNSFRKVIRDYFLICESYFEALKTATTSGKIEAIDMSRRAIHNEGSEILTDLLKSKAEVDFDTARRLFTLICILHFK